MSISTICDDEVKAMEIKASAQTVDKNENLIFNQTKQCNNEIDEGRQVQSKDSIRRIAEPPDGGWGWVVTFGAFIVNVIADGTVYSFGFFFRELYVYFDESKSLTAWIGSVLAGSLLLSGPFTSVFVSLFGFRRVAMFGAGLSALGFFLSTWSPNVQTMIVLFGLVGGHGLGLMYITSILTVGHYFNKKRALATGIALAGAGAGAIALAPLTEFLINLYSWKGAMWIISAISLNGVAMGALFRPIKQDTISSRSQSKQKQNLEKDKSDNEDEVKARTTCDCASIFDFSLLKRVPFLVYLASCFFCMLGFLSPSTFIPDHAADSGMTSQQSVIFITVISAASSITRVAAGWVADRSWSDTIFMHSVAMMLGGIATAFVPYYYSFELMIIYCIVLGAALGVFVAFMTIISVELLGIEKLTSGYGLVTMSMAIATYIGSPIAGALADLTGNYKATFYYAGTVMVLSGTLCLPLRRISKWESRRKQYISRTPTAKVDATPKLTVKCISFNNISDKC